jgi:transposase-like protein
MERPNLDTLACVNPECQLFRHSRPGHLVGRKIYGSETVRLLPCRSCWEAFSERRGIALYNTKVSEAQAVEVIDHLAEGGSVRSTARLVQVCTETVARTAS